MDKIREISRLLDEAYKHYFTYEGHCKSSEGHISIEYGNYWDRSDNPDEVPIKSVNVYSYVFGPDRHNEYDTLDEALETVRGWHAEEMAYDPNTPEAIENREIMDQMSGEFLSKLMDQGRLTIIEVKDEDEEK